MLLSVSGERCFHQYGETLEAITDELWVQSWEAQQNH